MRKYKPSVLVGITTYGRGRIKHLRSVVESVMAQTIEPLGIIVVDNSSNPETARALSEYPKVIYVDPGENVGPAGGYHIVIKRARDIPEADYLLILDDDSMLCVNDALETYIRYFERIRAKEPSLGALTCTRGESTISLKIVGRKFVKCEPTDEPVEIHLCGNSGLFISRDVFSVVNYRKELFFGTEDFTFCVDIIAKGFKIYILKDKMIRFCVKQVPHEASHTFLGKRILIYSPWRTYYTFKNYMMLIILHAKIIPRFNIFSLKLLLMIPLYLMFGHPKQSYYALLGIIDFLRGRMGKRFEPGGYDEN